MNQLRRPPPAGSRAPEPLDLHWIAAALPDALYVLPPDAALQPDGQGERPEEAILVLSVMVAIGLLVALVAISSALG